MGTFSAYKRYRNRCLIILPNFPCSTEVSLRAVLQFYQQCAASLFTTAHYISYFIVYSYLRAAIKHILQELKLDS